MSDADDPRVLPPRRPGGEPTQLDPRRPDTHDTVGGAIGLYIAAAFGSAFVLALLAAVGLGGGLAMGFALPGVTQLLGVVPLLIFAYRTGRRVLVKVTWICAGIVFLLNAACWGVLAVALSGISMADGARPPVDDLPPPREPVRTLHPQPVTALRVFRAVGVFVVCLTIVIALGLLAPVTLFAIGVTQMLTVGPAMVFAHRRKDHVLQKVLYIGAGLVFLLNAGCWGFFMVGGGLH